LSNGHNILSKSSGSLLNMELQPIAEGPDGEGLRTMLMMYT